MTAVVTFYSYKGGVGRTMGLVNTAHVLARDGRRVLMVDLDLEAPGMTHFFAKRVLEQVTPASKDALDLLLDAKRTLPEVEPERRTFRKVSLEEYVIRIPLPAAWLQTEETGSPYRNGRLDLLPATLEPTQTPEPSRDYLERMDALDLPGIFSIEGPRHRFGEHLRRYFTHARFRAPGDILLTMREEVWAAYDVVLVDSRTGLNEISGLCVGPVSDALVICTALNQQNVEGTRYFMRKAGLLEKERSKPYMVVVGPVPLWHTRVVEERAAEIQRILGTKEESVTIPYHPAAALTEKIFVLDDPEEPVARAYEGLGQRLLGLLAGMISYDVPREDLRDAFKTGEWGKSTREAAKWLPVARLIPTQHNMMLQQFATAVTNSLTPFIDVTTYARLTGADIAIPAAISALRLKSDAPFRRSWATLKRIGHGALEDWGLWLTFMQLRVLGTLPQHEAGSTLVKSMMEVAMSPHDNSWDRRFDHSIVLVYAIELGVIDARHAPSPSQESLRTDDDWELQNKWLDLFVGPQVGPLLREVTYFVLRPPDMAWLRSDFSERLRELAPQVRALSDASAGMVQIIGEDVAGRKRSRERLERYHSWSRGSDVLGIWPLPLMLSVISLIKGPEAIDEILAWVNLCRLFHGYAWRVLVDWRHLAEVRKHPKFVAFMEHDDAETEKIEAAIDRGRYPL